MKNIIGLFLLLILFTACAKKESKLLLIFNPENEKASALANQINAIGNAIEVDTTSSLSNLHGLRGLVRLVGVPHYAAEGCIGGRYCSQLVVAGESSFKTLADLRGQRAAYNGSDSQSGMDCFEFVLRYGVQRFENVPGLPEGLLREEITRRLFAATSAPPPTPCRCRFIQGCCFRVSYHPIRQV